MKLACAVAVLMTFCSASLVNATSPPAPINVASAVPVTSASISGATAEQLARLKEKLEITQRIVSSVRVDAEVKGATSDWSVGLSSVLYGLSNEALHRIEPGLTTLDQAHAAAANEASAIRNAAGSATAKALGDASNDLVFTPIMPCRFIDTRNVGSGVGTTIRVFDTANPGATYGGSSGCTLSGNGEPAVALNVTIVFPINSGFLVVRPQGSTNPTSFINWDTGAVQLANAGIIATTLQSNGHYDFEMFSDAGTPQVVVDYFGYFSAPSGTITGNGGGADGVDGVTTGAFNSGVYGKNTGGGKGVFGASATGQGVAGQSTSGDGMTGNSATGSGVYGQTQGTSGFSGAAGVWGDSLSYFGVWGTSSTNAGVWGESKTFDGVHGHTAGSAASGVAGFGDGNSAGLFGSSQSGNGAYGTSTSSNGVEGNSLGAGASGVYGQNSNASGYGIYGRNTAGGYGVGTDGPAFQSRNQGGWVKGMAFVAWNGSSYHIARCFNSQLPANSASVPPCGFRIPATNPGSFYIDFGFEVDDRFVFVQPLVTNLEFFSPVVELSNSSLVQVTNSNLNISNSTIGTVDVSCFVFVY